MPPSSRKRKLDSDQDFRGDGETKTNDTVIAPDGQLLYPCQYCNKVFAMKQKRADHILNCPSKSYILSVNSPPPKKIIEKIVIQQNISVGVATNANTNVVENKRKYKKQKIEIKDDLKCKHCGDTFRSNLERLKHFRQNHTYPKVVLSNEEVKKHYNAKDRSFCPLCGKPIKLQHKSVFIKHLQTHSNTKDFACDVCKRRFRRVDHMREHAKRHFK